MFSPTFRRLVLYSSAGLTLVGGGVLLKDALGGANFQEPVELKGKVAIVTGANTGIGYAVATGLAKRGAKVIMACRDRDRCETARESIVMESQNKYVYCRYCDLSSQDSVLKFARRINNEMEKVDILVNNAGIMSCPRETTKEGIEMQLGVNHMGHFLLTNLILDKLKAGAPSRIVNLTSVAFTKGKINVDDLNSEKSYNPDTAYDQSSLANILFTRELAKRLEGTGVTVNAVHPGITDTGIMRHKTARWYYLTWVVYPFIWPFIRSPRQGGQVVLHVALSKELNGVSGKYIGSDRKVHDEILTEEAKRDDLALWLWRVDEKWTNLGEKLVESKLPVQKKFKTAYVSTENDKSVTTEAAKSTVVPAITTVVPVTAATEEKSAVVISGENTEPRFRNPVTTVSA